MAASTVTGVATNSEYSNAFVSMQFNTIAIFIIPIVIWPARKRILFFDWLVTLIPNILILAGSYMRVHQIHSGCWPGNEESAVECFFTYTLAVWIGCVVLDGRHCFIMIDWYGIEEGYEMLYKMFVKKTTATKIQTLFTFFSTLSLFTYGTMVFNSFSPYTTNFSIYWWFVVTTAVKACRIVIQGLLLAADTEHVLIRKNRSFALQLILTNIVAVANILYLLMFKQHPTLLALSFIPFIDLGYRIIWTTYLGWVCYYYGEAPPQDVPQLKYPVQENTQGVHRPALVPLANVPVEHIALQVQVHEEVQETPPENPKPPVYCNNPYPYPFLNILGEWDPPDQQPKLFKIPFCSKRIHWRKHGKLFPKLQYFVNIFPKIKHFNKTYQEQPYTNDRSYRMHQPGD